MALSHVNAKGKGINSEGWVGNQVFRRIGSRKEKKRSEIYGKRSPKTVGGI
jgi:hypothetical protein